MEHVANIYVHKMDRRESSLNMGYMEELRKGVSEILQPKFHHPCAAIREKTLRRVNVLELVDLHGFLTNGSIESTNPFQRPTCPLRAPNQQNLARYDYKKAMVDYIHGFGYELKNNPCDYPAALLEALANYLEHQIENNRKKSGTKTSPIWNEK